MLAPRPMRSGRSSGGGDPQFLILRCLPVFLLEAQSQALGVAWVTLSVATKARLGYMGYAHVDMRLEWRN